MGDWVLVESYLKFWLSVPVLLFLVFFGSIPFLWPLMSQNEGVLFPVVENIEILDEQSTPSGLAVTVRFDKVRHCEFIGLAWYDPFGTRIHVDFFPDSDELPMSRPIGEDQTTRPWLLIGLETLEGTKAIAAHTCHPFWTTFTIFYI